MIGRTVAVLVAAAVAGAGLLAAPTAAPASAAVAASVRTQGGPLNVRSNASTWHSPVDRLADGTGLRASCQLAGERVAGSVRTTSLWLRIGTRRYVTDAYVAWRPKRPKLPWCDQPSHPAPRAHASFISWAAERARPSRREYRVPVSVTVAQAINESGWGRSSLTTEGNAYFGIKCFGIPGPIATGCRPYSTRECDDDDCFATTGTFRVYRRPADSFMDHGRFLTVNDRYRPAFKYTNDPDRFARAIHKAGYATDPSYSDKLIALMREFDLYRFDD
jgi:mannosyl-glycoprotein endo-beta-N-acetylglucosaminidase